MAVDTKVHMTMLEEMVDAARRDLANRQAEIDTAQLESRLQPRHDSRPFKEALTRPGISVIAEFKRRSPSAGNEISPTATVMGQVGAYERGGAAALSVLTDNPHFGGTLEDLQEARAACDLPILRKDFIFDRYQLLEAAIHGADAVLLIAAVLGDAALADLYEEARTLDLDCIVEVRKLEEMTRVLDLDADIIGINNRDLSTLEVDAGKTFDLLKYVPAGKTVVSESGIEGPDHIRRLQEAGVDAALIGHRLMGSDNPEAEMRFLLDSDVATSEQRLP